MDLEDEKYNQEVLKWIGIYQRQDLEIVPTTYVKGDGSCSCRTGADCPKPGKHPAVKDWTTKYTSKDKKPEKIRWDPRQGVGIRTGIANALLVMDCDSEQAYQLFLEIFPEARKTKTSKSFRGYHLFFKVPENMVFKGGTKVLDHIGIPNVDIRAERGFVMAPPSRHPEGGHYKWLNSEKVIDAPERLLSALKQGETSKASSEGRSIGWSASTVLSGYTIEVGDRHDTFCKLAVRYRSLGLERDEVLDLLLSTPYENPEDAPFEQNEIYAIVDWAFDTASLEENPRELLETLLTLYDYYSKKRFKGKGGGTDRDVIIVLIQQGLMFGVQRGEDIDVPISQRTLAKKAGINRKRVPVSLQRLEDEKVACEGEPVPGSRSDSCRLLTNVLSERIYKKGDQIESRYINNINNTSISLSGPPCYKSLSSLLSESVDFRWGKGGLGKTQAARLSILLAHSAETGQRVYRNKEVAKILSEHYGEQVETTALSEFFKKCSKPKILNRIDHGIYEIPEDIYERIEAYQDYVGENLAAEKQDETIEEERRQYRVKNKLWKAGLYSVFEGERLRLKLLREDGEYTGDCSDKLRELLVRALSNGEDIRREAQKLWPEHISTFESNLNRLNSLRGALAYYNGEVHYDLLNLQERKEVFWFKLTGDPVGMLRHTINELENRGSY